MNDHRYRGDVYATYASVSGLDNYLPSKYGALAHNLTRHLTATGPDGKVLDIGSGQGELLTLCRDLGLRAEGVDVSPELAESCRSRGLAVTLVTDLAASLAGYGNAIAIVTMIDVLEHFTKSEALDLLRVIRSDVLRPGGKLIVQVPNMQNPFAASNFFCDITHEWAYTQASIAQLLRNAGFRSVSVLPADYQKAGMYRPRRWLRALYYAYLRLVLLVDQPTRSRVLTPNLIAIADL